VFEIEKIKSSEGKNLFSSGIFYIPETDSSNKYAKSLSDECDFLVLTDYQAHGLGRMGRTWESEIGKNLTFTLVKHFDIDPKNIQAINYYFNYFLLACLKDFTAKKISQDRKFPVFEIKWPNDILADTKKISGLLIENSNIKNRFIIGVGLNVNQEIFPEEFANKSTSLKNIIGHETDLNELIIELLNVYSKNISLIFENKFEIIYKLWKNSSNMIGKEVVFQDNGANHKVGIIKDLLYDGGLLIQVDGEINTFYSGEIKLIPEKADPFKD